MELADGRRTYVLRENIRIVCTGATGMRDKRATPQSVSPVEICAPDSGTSWGEESTRQLKRSLKCLSQAVSLPPHALSASCQPDPLTDRQQPCVEDRLLHPTFPPIVCLHTPVGHTQSNTRPTKQTSSLALLYTTSAIPIPPQPHPALPSTPRLASVV